jgi:hypothetical protein
VISSTIQALPDSASTEVKKKRQRQVQTMIAKSVCDDAFAACT